jgi:hypothetical protein
MGGVMNRDTIFWAARLALGVIGVVLMIGSVRRLGRARAAANWPTAARVATLSIPLGWTGVGTGLLALAVAAGLSLGVLAGPDQPELVPRTWRGWLVAGTAALVVLVAGATTARRLVNRAELTALIRTPPRAPGTAPPPAQKIPVPDLPTPATDADPAVPNGGESGWVYRDATGAWYLAVATGDGHRLVRLTDFALVPAGTAKAPLSLAGSVEISVWPVTEKVPGAK